MIDGLTMDSHSAAETMKLGQALGELLAAGHVILLEGSLGAGKTTFSQGVARGCGVTERVTSPTFTIVAEYEGRVPLVHMDLYRLYGAVPQSAAVGALSRGALTSIDWDEYLESDAAVLVEWPQGVADEVDDALHLQFVRAPLPRVDERTIYCKSSGSRSRKLLEEWMKRCLF